MSKCRPRPAAPWPSRPNAGPRSPLPSGFLRFARRARAFEARPGSPRSWRRAPYGGWPPGRAARSVEGNPNFSEGNPSRAEQIPNPAERNPNSNPCFPSPNRSFSMTCADPHVCRPAGPFVTASLVMLAHAGIQDRERSAAKKHLSGGTLDPRVRGDDTLPNGSRQRRRRLCVSGCSSFLCLRFSFLRSHEASEGLAPFRSRTLGRHFADLATASLIEREHEGTSPPTEDGEKKTGGSIRCPARMRPLEKSSIRLEPLVSGRAPALHACECLTTPVF